MRVLATGGGGFIGSAVVRRLKEREHEAVVFGLPQDVRNREDVLAAVEGCDAVIHLAGVLGTHELFDAVEEAIDVNIKGTVSVLDACVAHKAKYVGITMPQVFPSIYTATKIAATRIASAYARTYNLNVSHVRAFNAYGPGQAHGEGHPQKILPTFATQAWRLKAGEYAPIPVWGDGTQTVDLISADDLAKVLVGALAVGGDATIDGGSGYPFTVLEIARAVCEHVGVNPLIEFKPMRRGEEPTQIVAEGEGHNLLDWDDVPNKSTRRILEDLAETIDWYKPEPVKS